MKKHGRTAIVVAILLGLGMLAWSHTLHMRYLVETINAQGSGASDAAAELIQREQFGDIVNLEPRLTRLHAVAALVRLGNDKAVSTLDPMLKDTDVQVRHDALAGLVTLGLKNQPDLAALVPGIKEGDPLQRNGTVVALVTIGTSSAVQASRIVPLVCAIMKAEGGARSSAGDVLAGLTSQRELSVTDLAPYLADPDEAVRVAAVSALGKTRAPSAVPLLLRALSTTPQVHRVALGALALVATQECELPLSAAIRNPDEDNEARFEAAFGLGRIGTQSAIAALIDALSDSDLRLQVAASNALARSGSPARLQVIAALASPNSITAVRAAQALGKMADLSAAPALIGCLSASNRSLRIAAAQALGFRGNNGAVTPLIRQLSDPDAQIAGAASDALARIGPAAIAPVAAAVTADDSRSYFAMSALVRVGQDALPQIAAMAKGDPQRQRWCIFALGRIGGPDSVVLLRRLSASPEAVVRSNAHQTLQQLGVSDS